LTAFFPQGLGQFLFMSTQKKAFFYVDGFNLYFSLKHNRWKRYYWLDIEKLCSNFLFPGHYLSKVKYFTSPVRRPPDKVNRQRTYLRALCTKLFVEITQGKFQYNEMECFGCHRKISVPKEKKTDVNIAVSMLSDSFAQRCDVQYLMTGDSDLAPAIRAIKELDSSREVFLLCPPKPVAIPGAAQTASRISKELIQICNQHQYVKESDLQKCLLPDEIKNNYGSIITRPGEWK